MQKCDFVSLINNLKPKEESELPYEDKPLLAEIANADVGDVVILEEVTVIRELWRGGNDNGIGMTLVEKGGSEGVVKNFDGSILPVGKVITVVGTKTKYNDKYSVEVREKSGGGIALDGEPLATVEPPAHNRAVPAPAAAPKPQASGRKSFLVIYYEEVLAKFKVIYDEEKNACAATHSVMIAYNRNEVSEEELSRWLAADDDVPF